jgi:uncharacterized protein YegJ (DUF2314 family)
MFVSPEDGDMNGAMAEGKKTLPRFLEALRNPPAGAQGFAVKMTFGADQPENMWVSDLETVDGHLRGTLANQPARLKAYKQGDPVIIKTERIVDWSYVEDGVLVGGYTLRVMFSRTPPAERPALQRDLGYRIE